MKKIVLYSDSKNPHKKILIIIAFLILFAIGIGLSYASWTIQYTQNDFDILGIKCFELELWNESEGIHLEKAVPTTEEDGKKQKGYTFTIKNVCDANAYYQVNLEELIIEEEKLSDQYIKVSLNDSKGKNLNTYEEVKKTLSNAETSHKLTSGSLEPEEAVTYNLKLWMDESTPAISEIMNKTFQSKITIIATYKEVLEQEIEVTVTSLTEGYSKEKEEFNIVAKSENYNLIEVSEDNIVYNPIDQTKEYKTEKSYTKEGIYKIYFKDEVGNVKEGIIETTKLDQTGPEIEIKESSVENGEKLEITLEDKKSGVKEYRITYTKEEEADWIPIENEENTIVKEVTENKVYYIWAKDNVGNITVVEKEVTKVEQQPPELEVTNELTTWGEKDRIILKASDMSGVHSYSITKENEFEWIEIENHPLDFETTKEILENGTYYISVKDIFEHITTKEIKVEKIDDRKPTIISVTGNPETWSESATLRVEAKDEEMGLYEAAYSFDGGQTWQEENRKTYLTNTSNIVIKVKDKNGNIEIYPEINITKIDDTEPIARVRATSKGVNITIEDNGSNDTESGITKREYKLDNGSWYTGGTVYNFTNVEEGEHKVSLRVTNGVGKTAIDEISIIVVAPTLRNVSKTENTGLWQYRTSITKLVIRNKINPISGSILTTDESTMQDGSVMSFIVPNENNTTYTAYLQGDTKLYLN